MSSEANNQVEVQQGENTNKKQLNFEAPQSFRKRNLAIVVVILGIWIIMGVMSSIHPRSFHPWGIFLFAVQMLVFLIGLGLAIWGAYRFATYWCSFDQIQAWEKLGFPKEGFPKNLQEAEAARELPIDPFIEQAAYVANLEMVRHSLDQELTDKRKSLESYGQTHRWSDLADQDKFREGMAGLEEEIDRLVQIRDSLNLQIQETRKLLIFTKDNLIDPWLVSELAYEPIESAGKMIQKYIAKGYDPCFGALGEALTEQFQDLIAGVPENVLIRARLPIKMDEEGSVLPEQESDVSVLEAAEA